MSTDRLLFRKHEDDNTDQHVYGWDGPWPPPDLMCRLVGRAGESVYDPTIANPKSIKQLVDSGYTVLEYKLNRSSEIDHSAPEDEHWFRGAEYLPVSLASDGS